MIVQESHKDSLTSELPSLTVDVFQSHGTKDAWPALTGEWATGTIPLSIILFSHLLLWSKVRCIPFCSSWVFVVFSSVYFWGQCHSVTLVGLELHETILPELPKHRDDKSEPPHPSQSLLWEPSNWAHWEKFNFILKDENKIGREKNDLFLKRCWGWWGRRLYPV